MSAGRESLFPAPRRVCSSCGRSVWTERCCGDAALIEPTIHVHRESSARPGAFHLLCRASMREEWSVGDEDAGATCPTCLAILEREARAAA